MSTCIGFVCFGVRTSPFRVPSASKCAFAQTGNVLYSISVGEDPTSESTSPAHCGTDRVPDRGSAFSRAQRSDRGRHSQNMDHSLLCTDSLTGGSHIPFSQCVVTSGREALENWRLSRASQVLCGDQLSRRLRQMHNLNHNSVSQELGAQDCSDNETI